MSAVYDFDKSETSLGMAIQPPHGRYLSRTVDAPRPFEPHSSRKTALHRHADPGFWVGSNCHVNIPSNYPADFAALKIREIGRNICMPVYEFDTTNLDLIHAKSGVTFDKAAFDDMFVSGPMSMTTLVERHDNTIDTISIDNVPSVDPLAGYELYNQKNWDGYGAEPITTETLCYARRLLSDMPTIFGPPDIAPSGDGAIGLEWVPERWHPLRLFLDIGPGEVWRAYWTGRDGQFGRMPGSGYNSDTKKILVRLFASLNG